MSTGAVAFLTGRNIKIVSSDDPLPVYLLANTAVIGHVIVDSGSIALSAGSAAIGKTNVNPGAAALTVTAINIASSGDNTIIAAGTGQQTIKVYRLFLVATAATTLTFKDGSVTDGAISLAANEGVVLSFDGEPWFVGAAATAFKINLGSVVQVTGRIYSITS